MTAADNDKNAAAGSSSFPVLDAFLPFVFQLNKNDTNETLSTNQELVHISRRTRDLFLAIYPPNESFFLKRPPTQQTNAAQRAKGITGVQNKRRNT